LFLFERARVENFKKKLLQERVIHSFYDTVLTVY
jgi:hypothetical protein